MFVLACIKNGDVSTVCEWKDKIKGLYITNVCGGDEGRGSI